TLPTGISTALVFRIETLRIFDEQFHESAVPAEPSTNGVVRHALEEQRVWIRKKPGLYRACITAILVEHDSVSDDVARVALRAAPRRHCIGHFVLLSREREFKEP